MPVKGPHNRKSIAKAVWVAQAVKLSNEGHSLRSIASKVGKSRSTVWEVLQEEFARVRAPAEEVELLRNIQRAQLHRQLEAWIPRSLKGSRDAAVAVSRFLDRAAKLDGLDAPSRNEHTGAGGGAIPVLTVDLDSLSEQQLEAFSRGGYAALAGAGAPGAPAATPGRDGPEGGG